MSGDLLNKNIRLPKTIRKNINNFLDMIENNFFPDGGNIGFKANVAETSGEYIITAELPGIDKKYIDIDLNGNYLTISARRKDEAEIRNDHYISREISYGIYKRTFCLENASDENISAKYDNGILKIKVPKIKKSSTKIKNIDIE